MVDKTVVLAGVGDAEAVGAPVGELPETLDVEDACCARDAGSEIRASAMATLAREVKRIVRSAAACLDGADVYGMRREETEDETRGA